MALVFIPATLAMLRQFVADGSLSPVNGTAFAVTPTLREAYSEGDDDELAEVALQEAALASLRLLADEAGDLPPRRAVLAAEIEDVKYRPDLDDAVVRLGAPVPIDDVIAAYVDNADAESAVTKAIEFIDAADLGDEDAELIVGDAQDHDLAWYANQELPFLLDLL
jgi:hypothetical protein